VPSVRPAEQPGCGCAIEADRTTRSAVPWAGSHQGNQARRHPSGSEKVVHRPEALRSHRNRETLQHPFKARPQPTAAEITPRARVVCVVSGAPSPLRMALPAANLSKLLACRKTVALASTFSQGRFNHPGRNGQGRHILVRSGRRAPGEGAQAKAFDDGAGGGRSKCS